MRLEISLQGLLLRLLTLLLPFPSLSSTLYLNSPPRLRSRLANEMWFHQPPSVDDGRDPSDYQLPCDASKAEPDRYAWKKDGEVLHVGDGNVRWLQPNRTGTIVLIGPSAKNQGFYQCFASNMYGTALSNRVHLRMGVFGYFGHEIVEPVVVEEGDALTLNCSNDRLFSQPPATFSWLYRDSENHRFFQTINNKSHISVDGEGNLHFAHVKPNDGRQTLRYQCAAKCPQLKGEQRVGALRRLVVIPVSEEELQRKSRRPTRLMWSSPSELTTTTGQRVQLTCIFSGISEPSVHWSKVGGSLSFERIDLGRNFGRTLTINHVLPHDQATYVCSAAGISHMMRLQVKAAPYWKDGKGPPAEVVVRERDDAELHCRCGGRPEPVIRWMMNGRPILNASSSAQLVDQNRTLRLISVDHDIDTAVYQCNVSNQFGYLFENIVVYVKAHKPEFVNMPARQVHRVLRNGSVNLNCSADGGPKPVAVWVNRNNFPVTRLAGRRSIFENNTLRLQKLLVEDTGVYYCNVSNIYGVNRAEHLLNVYEHTHFIKDQPKAERVEAGSNVRFVCEAKADSRLEVTYRWYMGKVLLDEKRMVQDGHFRLMKSSSSVGQVLELVKARGRHSARFICAASSLVDTIKTGWNLTVTDVPDPPLIVELSCGENEAKLRWWPSKTHLDAVIRYDVEVYTNHERRWRRVFEESLTNAEVFEAHPPLRPDTQHMFRIFGVSSRGRSEAAVIGTISDDDDDDDDDDMEEKDGADCEPAAAPPFTNPARVRLEGSAPDNLIISWKPMERRDWNGGGLEYLVHYMRCDDYEAGSTSWNEDIIKDAKQNRTTIHPVPTFTCYKVKVYATNAEGLSTKEPLLVTGSSGEDVPSLAPDDFHAVALNSTAVLFTWTPLNEESINGWFNAYKIEVWRQGGDPKKALIVEFVHQLEVNSWTLNHSLRPMQLYTVRISAVNKKYTGPSSQKTFRMKEGVPTEVTNLRVHGVGSRTLLIRWGEPAEWNGRRHEYSISITSRPTSPNGNISEETRNVPFINNFGYYLYDTGRSDSDYIVEVSARSGAGTGPPAVGWGRTWPADRRPDKPRVRIAPLPPAGTSARLTWLTPYLDADADVHNRTVMLGSSFYVNYSLHDSAAEWKRTTEEVRLPQRSDEVDGLLSRRRYSFVLVAVDEEQSTASDPILYTVGDSEVHDRRRMAPADVDAEAFSSAAWFIAVICSVVIALLTVLTVCACQNRKAGKYSVKKREMESSHGFHTDEGRTFLEYQYGESSGAERL